MKSIFPIFGRPSYWTATFLVFGLGWSEAATPPAILPNLQLTRPGAVRAMLAQPEGHVIVAGNFLFISGTPRPYLARLDGDGRVVTNWGAALDGPVRILATNETSLFVLGDFSNIGGVARAQLAKLSLQDGALDQAWQPNVPTGARLTGLAVSGSDVFISGSFDTVGGQPRSRLAKVSVHGGGAVDPLWNPGLGSGSAHLMVVTGTNLYLAGYFYQVGGANRTGLARVSTGGTGAVDPVWAPPYSSPPGIRSVQVDSGFVYVLESVLTRIPVAGNGTPDPAWPAHPLPVPVVRSFLVAGTNLYLGGRTNVVRASLALPHDLDPVWQPYVSAEASLIQPLGTNLYLAGSFDRVNDDVAIGLARVDPRFGWAEPSFAPRVELPAHVFALAVEPTGRLIVGGRFAFAGLVPRRNLARVNPDGSLDQAWQPEADGPVTRLLVHSNDVFVAGGFSWVGGQARRGIAKLSLFTGETDAQWRPEFYHGDGNETRINTMVARGADLYVAGFFNRVNEHARLALAKVSTLGEGSVDAAWDPAPGPCCSFYLVRSLALVGSHLFAGGTFESIGGINQQYAAKLDAFGSGAAVASWRPAPSSYVNELVTDGTSLFVGGQFTNIGGLDRSCLAKLDLQTGAALADWNAGPHCGGHLTLQGTNLYVARMVVNLTNVHMVITRLETLSATQDAAWLPVPNIPPANLRHDTGWPVSTVYAIAAGPGVVYVGGDYTEMSGLLRNGLAGFDSSPGLPRLRYPVCLANRFACELVVEPGNRYSLQSSSDFASWDVVSNIISTVPVVPFSTPATGRQRFHRLEADSRP